MYKAVENFRSTIETDSELFALANQMFEEIPPNSLSDKDPTGNTPVRDFPSLLDRFNDVVVRAPEFIGPNPGVVELPFTSIIDKPLGTKSGRAFFMSEKVNDQLREILQAWTKFLSSEVSTHVLNESPRGWFSPNGLRFLSQPTVDHDHRNFVEEFICDPKKEHYGFKSWDSFFTRKFRAGIRPVAWPDNKNIIVNACESCPWRLIARVQAKDRFWIKEQPYSLQHIMGDSPLIAKFVGGSIYQGFLNAGVYHRWHSPVDGYIAQIRHIPGTYFTKTQTEAFDAEDPKNSQGYITATSTRVLIFIQADNEDIGLMCVIPVGWVEVSTCEVTVREGQRVIKGDELGMFHFGGSTHCLLFRPGVQLQWDFHGQVPGPESKAIPINSQIARVERQSRL